MSIKDVSLCCHPHRLQHFKSFYRYGVIFYSGLWRHNTVSFWSAHCCACVWVLPLCFKYSQDDRHSIYLDVYCFELLGMGNAWAGIHIRKRPIWTSPSGENTRMTWLTHTQALNGSSLSKWWAWDTAIQMFQVKPRNGTFLCLWTSSIRKHGVSLSLTHSQRHNAFKTFTSLLRFCALSDV